MGSIRLELESAAVWDCGTDHDGRCEDIGCEEGVAEVAGHE